MLALELIQGGSARLLTSDGESCVLASSRPAPPGSTLEGSAEGVVYRVKVRSCRRDAATDAVEPFRVEGRFVSLTRAQRTRVLQG